MTDVCVRRVREYLILIGMVVRSEIESLLKGGTVAVLLLSLGLSLGLAGVSCILYSGIIMVSRAQT